MQVNAMQVHAMQVKTMATLGCCLVAIALVNNPPAALALPPSLLAQQPANALDQLNLTPEQETQLADIQQTTQVQIETVLSSSQQQRLRAELDDGVSFRQAIARLNLSPDQRTELRSIMGAARQSAAEVLTPAQRQQMRRLLRDRRQQQGR